MPRMGILTKATSNIIGRVIFFGRNSSIHGLKYVFEKRGSKISKFIWLFILLFFNGCLYVQLVPVVERGNTVNFTPDTRYLDWTTTFPAVTVCETYSPKNVLKKLSALFRSYVLVFKNTAKFLEPLNYDYRRYVADLIYGRGSCSRSLCIPCGTTVPCDVAWRDIIENVHKNCNEMISDCRFNNKEISCCKHFRAVDSEYGICFSFNSLQSKYNEVEQLVVNRTSGPGTLNFRLLSDSQVTLHTSGELSTNVLDKKLRFNVKTSVENYVDFQFSVIDIVHDPLLQDENIDVRKCRFNYEVPRDSLHTYQVYSYSACRSAQSIKKLFEHCQCVHPVRDISYEKLYCNYTGLNCLVTYEALKTKLGKDNRESSEDCLPSCVDKDLSAIYLSKRWTSNTLEGSIVNIKMLTLPTLRYQQNLLRTKTDLVVTVGGMVGLFFSASILSIVEIFYLILRK